MLIWVAELPRVDQLTKAMPHFWRAVYICAKSQYPQLQFLSNWWPYNTSLHLIRIYFLNDLNFQNIFHELTTTDALFDGVYLRRKHGLVMSSSPTAPKDVDKFQYRQVATKLPTFCFGCYDIQTKICAECRETVTKTKVGLSVTRAENNRPEPGCTWKTTRGLGYHAPVFCTDLNLF